MDKALRVNFMPCGSCSEATQEIYGIANSIVMCHRNYIVPMPLHEFCHTHFVHHAATMFFAELTALGNLSNMSSEQITVLL